MKKHSRFYTDKQGRVRYIADKTKSSSDAVMTHAPERKKAGQFITTEGQVVFVGGPGAGGGSGGSSINIIGGTEEQNAAVKTQVDYLQNLGFVVPKEVEIRRGLPSLGVTLSNDRILLQYAHPEALKYAITHEIGHMNEPNDWTTWNIWEGTSVKIGGVNWRSEAGKISEYAKTNPSEFWAEKFAKEYTL